jgi:hypothetical protein
MSEHSSKLNRHKKETLLDDHKMGTSDQEESIKLSVQGAFFILKKEMIMSHDWILSKILTSDIPWEMASSDGQVFIDVDPTAFRLIISVLNGIMDLSTDLNKLSLMDLALMKATTRYLMLHSLADEIDGIEGGAEKVIQEKEDEIVKKEKEITQMKKKTKDWDELGEILDTNRAQLVVCQGYNRNRSAGRCICWSLVLGPLAFNEEAEKNFTCRECVSQGKFYLSDCRDVMEYALELNKHNNLPH